jgi:hypothetical protein
MQAQTIEDGPSAPDLQLDWLSSSSDSDDTDDDSGIEVVSVQYKQSAQRVSQCELRGEKCIQNFERENGKIIRRLIKRNYWMWAQ